ncbi:MAG TPA: acyltransferase family protein [Candidatus Bathyarchaeia archaeon]|nr:acyltransferase family protein [Candidatus Bathyarchaeia archaeon]
MAKKRLLSIDFLRFWAIILMFWDHGLKLFYNFDTHVFMGAVFTRLAVDIINLTALSSAIFLFLSGFCLALSFNKHTHRGKTDWLWKKFKKGIWLIFLSYLLFFYEYNLAKINTIATSGILQLIGTGLIAGSILFLFSRKTRIIILIFLNYLTLMIDLALRLKGIVVPFLNVYNFPLLPSISYFLSGILIGDAYLIWLDKDKAVKNFKNLFLVSLAGVFVFLSAVNFNPYIIFDSRYLIAGFWQPSVALVIFNTFLIIAILSQLIIVENQLRKIDLIRQASLLGQETLAIYCFHILFVYGASKYVLKGATFGFWASLIAIAASLWISWRWVKIRLKIKKER